MLPEVLTAVNNAKGRDVEAVQLNSNPWSDLEGCDQIKLNPIKVLLVFNDVECLLEAAYHYSKKV